jgi:hypothetical protein
VVSHRIRRVNFLTIKDNAKQVSRIEFQGFDRLEDAQAFCEKNALDVERAVHGDSGPPEAL